MDDGTLRESVQSNIPFGSGLVTEEDHSHLHTRRLAKRQSALLNFPYEVSLEAEAFVIYFGVTASPR